MARLSELHAQVMGDLVQEQPASFVQPAVQSDISFIALSPERTANGMS